VRLEASVEGSFKEAMTAEARRAARAVTAGVGEARLGLKSELRRQITVAGLGERLARTWRSEVCSKGRQSIDAAGYVWSKAPGLIRLYAQGAIIRSRRGPYLAVPTPAAGKYGDARKKITPGDWERIHGMRPAVRGVVVDDLVERDDELLEMLPLLRVPRIDWILAVGANDALR
jgi:hypothetical protein